MKLTHKDVWHIYAGGCWAAQDKCGYKAITSIGNYSIQPISHRHNVNKHLGYVVNFENVLGKVGGGLNQRLYGVASLDIGTALPVPVQQRYFNLRAARRLCQEHMEKHGGYITPIQYD